MFLALLAYLRVDRVSSKLSSAGEIAQIIAVLEFPPNAFLKIKVNLESLYGTKVLSIFDELSASI